MIRLKGEGDFNKVWAQDELPNEDTTDYDKALMNFFIMKKMREVFGEKSYNREELFPDPRIQWPPKQKRKLTRWKSKL